MTLDTWLGAFAFTQACELPLWFLAFRRGGAPRADALVLGFCASALTHPIVWFGFPRLPLPYAARVALSEAFAVGFEALFARRFGVPRAWAWSLGANGLSAGLGLALRAWLDPG